MNDLERELQEQLQNFEVPKGLTDRVMRRVEARNTERRWWRSGIAAAVLIGICIGGEAIEMHQKMEHRRAEVQREFAVAMQVTNRSMIAVQRAFDRMDKSKGKKEGEAE